MDASAILTIRDVARILQISCRQAYEIIDAEGLPFFMVGGGSSKRIVKEDLDKWIIDKKKNA